MSKKNMPKIVIQQDKSKVLLGVLYLICILVPATLLAFSNISGSIGSGRNRTTFSELAYTAAAILLIFILPILIILARRLFNRTPGLVISSKGLQITHQPKQSSFLLWQQIKSFNDFSVSGGQFIAIHLRHPVPHLAYGNWWQKFLRKANYRAHKTPIIINCKILLVDYEELQEKLYRYWRASTKK